MIAFETGDSNVDFENVNKTNSSSTREDVGSPKKCTRKGEIVYYAKRENITMLNNTIDESMQQKNGSGRKEYIEGSSSERLSGESAYKTYIFEENDNDTEIEKCITFWKSVMEKNLQPIKCTIIDNKKRQENKINLEPLREHSNSEEINAAVEKAKASIHGEYKTMLIKAVNDMQKLKLESVRLIGKARCKLCDALEKPIEEYNTEQDSEAIKKEIESLNSWKPISRRKRFDDKERRRKRNSCDQGKQKQSDSNTCEGKDKSKVDRKLEYKFVNIIEQKKREGVYSKWRDNLVKTLCDCGKLKCECNINPAIKSIKRIQGPICDVENAEKDKDVPGKEEEEIQIDEPENVLEDEAGKLSEQLFTGFEKWFNEESKIDKFVDKTDTQVTVLPTRDFEHETINVNTSFEQSVTQSSLPTKEFDYEEIKISTQMSTDIEPSNDIVTAETKNERSTEFNTIMYDYDESDQDLISVPFPMDRTVSIILPSGEVEIIKRESIDDTDWDKPKFPIGTVSLVNTRSSIDAIRKRLGRQSPMDRNQHLRSSNEIKTKSADIHRKPSSNTRKSHKKKQTSFAKVLESSSTHLEILHQKNSNPYELSTIFMIPK